MRKCRLCKNELPKVSESNIYQKAGFCACECLAQHSRDKVIGQLRREQIASDKQARAEHREAKIRIKTRSQWVKEAQVAFNSYIRARDEGRACISCGNHTEQKRGGTTDAGHYRSTGSSPECRFLEENCHAQCVKCNRYLSGSAVDYRIGLIAKIGLKAVEELEGPHEARHYTIEDLKAIKAKYKDKLKALQSERAA